MTLFSRCQSLSTKEVFIHVKKPILMEYNILNHTSFEAFQMKKKGCFPLCQTDRSEISIFRLNWANQQKWLLPFYGPFLNSLIRAKKEFVKNGTANFDQNIPTEINRPPPEFIPNIPVRRNRNGPHHLHSDRNFQNLWKN